MTETHDSRQYTRYQPVCWNHAAQLTVQDRRFNAAILDESLGGLGLRLLETAEIRHGQVMRIDDGKIARRARVVFAATGDDGQLRLGIEWTPDSSYEEVN